MQTSFLESLHSINVTSSSGTGSDAQWNEVNLYSQNRFRALIFRVEVRIWRATMKKKKKIERLHNFSFIFFSYYFFFFFEDIRIRLMTFWLNSFLISFPTPWWCRMKINISALRVNEMEERLLKLRMKFIKNYSLLFIFFIVSERIVAR